MLDLERTGPVAVAGAVRSGRSTVLRTLAAGLADGRRPGRRAPLRARLRQPGAGRAGRAAALRRGGGRRRHRPRSSGCWPCWTPRSAAGSGCSAPAGTRRWPSSGPRSARPAAAARGGAGGPVGGVLSPLRRGGRRAAGGPGRAAAAAGPGRRRDRRADHRPDRFHPPRVLRGGRPAGAAPGRPGRRCRLRASTRGRCRPTMPPGRAVWVCHRRGGAGRAARPDGDRRRPQARGECERAGGRGRCAGAGRARRPAAAPPRRPAAGPGHRRPRWRRCGPAPAGRRRRPARSAVGGDHLGPVDVDLVDAGGSFVVAGPPRSGPVHRAARRRRSGLPDRPASCRWCVVAPRPSPLRGLAGEPGVLDVLTGDRRGGRAGRRAG